jgi:hypothetical protein
MDEIVPASSIDCFYFVDRPHSRKKLTPAAATLSRDSKRAPFGDGKQIMNSREWRTKSKISQPKVNVADADRSNRHRLAVGQTLGGRRRQQQSLLRQLSSTAASANGKLASGKLAMGKLAMGAGRSILS